MKRSAVALLTFAAVLFVWPAQSDPGTGSRVPTLAEFNALEARVTAIESAPVTPEPTPTPTPTPTVTPAPTPTAPATGFPNAATTGDPSTADNTASGALTISTTGATVSNKTVTGILRVSANDVTITASTIRGTIVFDPGVTGGKVTDSTVYNTDNNGPGISRTGFTATRVEVVGGRVSVECTGGCTVVDSWLHGQQTRTDWHADGFLSNGGSNMTLRHNTLACDAPPVTRGACSSAVALYGDWDPITNVTVDGNLFKSSPASYCLYGASDGKPYGSRTANVKITNNVFERGASGKCAAFGPAAAVASGSNGNLWSGNRWDDGATIPQP